MTKIMQKRSKNANSADVKQSAKELVQASEKLVKNVLASKPVKKAIKQVDKTGKKIVTDIKKSPKIKKAVKTVKTKSQKVINKVPVKTQETIKVKGEELIKKVKELLNEGNVRKIIIKSKEGKDILVIPMTWGVVGVLVAPVLAAVGAVAALVSECSITVEREK